MRIPWGSATDESAAARTDARGESQTPSAAALRAPIPDTRDHTAQGTPGATAAMVARREYDAPRLHASTPPLERRWSLTGCRMRVRLRGGQNGFNRPCVGRHAFSMKYGTSPPTTRAFASQRPIQLALGGGGAQRSMVRSGVIALLPVTDLARRNATVRCVTRDRRDMWVWIAQGRHPRRGSRRRPSS